MGRRPDRCDYPAAHSMDTEWFAVDRGGRVAVLDSLEAGAVPVEHLEAQGTQTSSWDLLDGLPVDEHGWRTVEWMAGQQVAGNATRRAVEEAHQHWQGYTPGRVHDLLLVLSHPVPVAYFAAKGPNARFAGEPLVVYMDDVSAAALVDALRDGVVTGGRGVDPAEELPSWLGMFRYEHGDPWENHSAGPYRRETVPESTVRLEQLPEGVARRTVKIDVDFSDSEWLQPIEHATCAAWSRRWVSSDGEQHEDEDLVRRG